MKYVNSHCKDLGIKALLCDTNFNNKAVFPSGLSKDQTVIQTHFNTSHVVKSLSLLRGGSWLSQHILRITEDADKPQLLTSYFNSLWLTLCTLLL